jgi:hypothetical protein
MSAAVVKRIAPLHNADAWMVEVELADHHAISVMVSGLDVLEAPELDVGRIAIRKALKSRGEGDGQA